MKHLSIAGLAAVAVLALGLANTTPAEAKVFITFGTGYGFNHGFHHGFGHRFGTYCGWKTVRYKVRRHHRWVWVYGQRRVCY